MKDAGPPPSDTDLLLAVQRREPGADRALWDRFAPMVRGLLRRALGPDEDVADAVQDVFMKLFAHVRDVRDPNAFRSFVVSITMNELRLVLRRRKVRRIIRLTRSGSVPDQTGQPGAAPERAALVRFYALLDRLSTEERACFVLRHVEGLELTEVAQALDLSLATVKRRLTRAGERIMSRVRQDPFLVDFVRQALEKEPNGHA